MVELKSFVKLYLILAIIYSTIFIINGASFVISNSRAQIIPLPGPVILGWLILSLIIILLFIIKKVEKIAFLIPGLYIFERIFSLIIRMIWLNRISIILSLIFPIIALVVAIKLIRKV